ncbi:type I-C CRISPR-associated protein Cas5c [Streptomyces abyssomicinicus]|uniref:type I-C CRISPR-associated protein Cas5c n=1 Tax=Streptomyces abyssomicinicus TaxID=574929 RepID=UPI0015813F31|nr:type I-C CRISPR-associated protein Cas5c [Streptomyces abyssomicinicus]
MFPDLVVEVSGPLACFTRPELKVERVSYPVMTPSAAVGVLEAIFWKPEMAYVITAIEVLKPIEWTQVRRNEVKSVVSATEVAALRKDPTRRYDVERDRDQRNSMLLRDVHYRIRAQILRAPHAMDVPEQKYRDQLRRRVDKGACFSEPYLGCREFSAAFGPQTDAQPIGRDEDLGVMLHSISYPDSGGEQYRWFHARLLQGVMTVPLAPLGADAVAMPASSGWRADGPRAGR